MDIYRIEFELPGLPRMTNPSGRKTHWAIKAKEVNHWKSLVALHVSHVRPIRPLKRAKLKFTRYSSSCPDPDGLVSGFKHILDGLVLARVLENDKMTNIGMPEYVWVKTSPKCGKVKIEVMEIQDEETNGNTTGGRSL